MTLYSLLNRLIIATILSSSISHAKDFQTVKPEDVGVSSERLKNVEALATTYIDKKMYSGIVTLLARDGKIVHQQAVGNFGTDNDKALEVDSLFRIYSMTKPITAAAAMILYEQGKFHLDDPISKFLPQFKQQKVLLNGTLKDPTQPVTIRHLLTHTAGLTYGWTQDNPVDVQYAEADLLNSDNLDEFIQELSQIPLRFEPGTRYHYSVAFDVLGAIIEKLSGMPLDQFFEQKIFLPLGMQDTFFEVPEDQLHRLVDDQTWDYQENKNRTVSPENQRSFSSVSMFLGGGGLVSTVQDYLRFSQMILNQGEFNGTRILSPKTIELMSSDHLSDKVRAEGVGEYPVQDLYNGQSMGFGYGVVTNASTMPDLSSIGELSWGGFAGTKFWIDPQEKLIGIALVQQYQSPWTLRSDLKTAVYQALQELR